MLRYKSIVYTIFLFCLFQTYGYSNGIHEEISELSLDAIELDDGLLFKVSKDGLSLWIRPYWIQVKPDISASDLELALKTFKNNSITVYKGEAAESRDGVERLFGMIVNNEGTYLSETLISKNYATLTGYPCLNTWDDEVDPLAFFRHLKSMQYGGQKGRLDSDRSEDVERFLAEFERSGDHAHSIADDSQSFFKSMDVNTASLVALESLPGVGSKTAQRIIDGRPYETIKELKRVSGISDKKLADLNSRLHVAPPASVEGTATFLIENEARFLSRYVSIQIASFERQIGDAPPGYVRYSVKTSVDGRFGGRIAVFIREHRTDAFENRHSTPEIFLNGKFSRWAGELSIVAR